MPQTEPNKYPACNCFKDDGNPRWAQRSEDKCSGTGRFTCRGKCRRRVPRCYRVPGTKELYLCRDCEAERSANKGGER